MIYLASPYSHKDPDVREQRYQRVRSAQVAIARAGMPVISPIVLWHPAAQVHDLPTDALFWRRQNHATLDMCSECWVLTIDGWQDSEGVSDETRYSVETGKTIRFVDVEGKETAPPIIPKALRRDTDRAPGAKHDAGKRRYDLVPWGAIGQMVDVLGHGAAKYSAEGWRTVPDARQRYFAALMRHVIAWYCGERTDPESGMHHLAHALCNVAILIEGEPE